MRLPAATSANNKYGYVFESNTISGYGPYVLGRPWQNEPRAYFLNTVMIAEASAEGWGSMGTLPTHFYEYNSMDKDGNPIDLSTRKNSPTSTNSYTHRGGSRTPYRTQRTLRQRLLGSRIGHTAV